MKNADEIIQNILSNKTNTAEIDKTESYEELTDLLHFGTKGMQWGVRNSRPKTLTGQISGKDPVGKPDLKAFRKWEAEIIKNYRPSINSAIKNSPEVVTSINKKYENADLNNPKVRDAYYKEHSDGFNKLLSSEFNSRVNPNSPVGKITATISVKDINSEPTLNLNATPPTT